MQENIIKIRGARMHNLQDINLELPKNKIIVFTGVSGSGKSTLAFDTIFAEGQRRYIESLSPYIRQFLGQMDRPDVDEITGLSPAIAINQKALSHNPRSTVGTLTEIYDYLRVLFARLGEVYCPQCGSKLDKMTIDEMVDFINEKKANYKNENIKILSPVVRGRKGEYYQLLYDYLNLGYETARIDGSIKSLNQKIILARNKKHDIEIVVDELANFEETRLYDAVEQALDYSQGLVIIIMGKEEFLLSSQWNCPHDGFSYGEIEPRLFSFNSPFGACPNCMGLGKMEWHKNTICPACQGKRLKPESLSIKIKNKNIFQITALNLKQAQDFFKDYMDKLPQYKVKIAINPLKEIQERLNFLNEVGLDYITLARSAETLSGGEAQRIRLASQIGTQLSGALYVLDEPTIGLHERDTDKLIKTIKTLKNNHNTLIVVEHDELTINEADYLVDLGPGAGEHGGLVVAQGEIKDLLKKDNQQSSSTLEYLRGNKKIIVPTLRRKQNHGFIKIQGATKHNLKNLNVEIPLQRLVCITGVSGSGKSTLLHHILYHNFQKVKNQRPVKFANIKKLEGAEYLTKAVMVNQSPIGRTPRSNPATYTGIFTPVREFFAELPSARERAYKPSRFSFNVSGGRCEACNGVGYNMIEMHFLPAVWVKCNVCHGQRYNRETLQVKYKHKNIADVLNMTISQALKFFSEIPFITDKLKVLEEVGLGYIRLGQSAPTLSGGEAQRVKLGKELALPLNKRVLYLFDEPTVGLHYDDLQLLIKVLQKLVAAGHSVVVIEHNLHLIKCCDYIIDMGPEGGDRGGKIIAKGMPEDIVRVNDSYTGLYLNECLK
ncbi:MAG: excinuclease ABC subunit UvrA [Patescibacteria group bacterium]